MDSIAPTLGLLGLGSRSTLFYLAELNRCYNQQKGGYSTCPLVLVNSDFDRINPYLPDQFDRLNPVLNEYLQAILSRGVDHIVIPNITLHECYDRSYTNIAVIHAVNLTLQQLQINNCQKVVLFGSDYTMQSTYLSDQFARAGIERVLPDVHDQSVIDGLRKRVYAEQESLDDIAVFNQLVKKYRMTAPVVIACTELSIALNYELNNVYDMARIQIKQAII